MFLKPTSKLINLNVKTLHRYCARREELETDQRYVWDFIGRLPPYDMKLIDALKGLVQSFRHDNARPCYNQKYVLKLRMVSRDHEPHIKYFFAKTQT